LDFGEDLNLKVGPAGPDGKPTLPYKYEDTVRRNPFDHESVGMWFVGVSYNFK
jgi:hypothetical protein